MAAQCLTGLLLTPASPSVNLAIFRTAAPLMRRRRRTNITSCQAISMWRIARPGPFFPFAWREGETWAAVKVAASCTFNLQLKWKAEGWSLLSRGRLVLGAGRELFYSTCCPSPPRLSWLSTTLVDLFLLLTYWWLCYQLCTNTGSIIINAQSWTQSLNCEFPLETLSCFHAIRQIYHILSFL